MIKKDEQTADLDTLLTQMRQKYSERLALGVALVMGNSQELATDADVMTRSWLRSLTDDSHILGLKADTFEKVKVWAQDAFSESPTDAEILANSATPDLMRYLLAALRAYDGEQPQNLPTAFKLRRKGKFGKPSGVALYWVEIEEAARAAFDRTTTAGKTKEEAMQSAVEAGFQEYRRASGRDPDPKDSKQK